MNLLRCPLLLIPLAAIGGAQAAATEPAQAEPPAGVLAEFSIFNDGDVLLIPVTVAGKQHAFVVDTGFSVTTFDTRLSRSLTLAPAAERTVRVAGAGTMERAVADEFSITGLPPFRGQKVWRGDLSHLREATGHDVAGIIGIDLLRPFVLQIDADQAQLRFLEKTPASDVQPIPLRWKDSGTPLVQGSPAAGMNRDFILDTGLYSLDVAVDLGTPLYRELETRRALTTLYSIPSATVDRLRETRTGVLAEFSLAGGPTLKNVRATEHADGLNLLGLTYLLQYNALMDFPHDRLLLTPRERPRETNLPRTGSGASLLWRDGATFVLSVRDNSRAAAAGIRSNDVLETVAGRAATDFRLHTLRLAIESAGAELELTVRALNGPPRRVRLSREETP